MIEKIAPSNLKDKSHFNLLVEKISGKRMILLLGFFIALSFTRTNVYASHMMGADLKYQTLTNDTIEFTLSFYRDCTGIPAIASEYTIKIQSLVCNIYTSCQVYLDPNATEVSPLCPFSINQSSCSGGSLPGVQQFVYRGKMFLPQACNDYLFSWEDCCRNNIITNVLSPASVGLRIDARFNKLIANNDNSPTFSSLPVFYICQGQLFNYSQGGYDLDGDSLAYSLVDPLTDTGIVGYNLFLYNSPFNSSYPLTTASGTVGFNSQTGEISILPTILEITCVAIRINEYRNGNLIGSVMRDMQVVVMNCNNNLPQKVLGNFENLQGATITGINIVELCPGGTVSFDLYAHDPDGDNLTISSNITSALNGGTAVVTTFLPDSGKIHLSWTPGPSDVGNNIVSVTLTDDACPVYGQNTYAFVIHVMTGTNAGPDLAICFPDTSVQLIATGGNVFSWSPGQTLSDSTAAAPVAHPTVTTTYYIESNPGTLCNVNDTVIVYVFPAFNASASISTDTVCAGTQIQLFSGISGGGGFGYQAVWTDSIGTFYSTQLNPFAYPLTTTSYYLNASEFSCHQFDTLNIFVNPQPVVLTITAGGPTAFCGADSVLLLGNTSGVWNAGGSTDSTLLATAPGDYFVTTSNSCGTTNSNTITVTFDQPPVPAIIIANGPTTFCSNSSVTLSGNNAGGVWFPVGDTSQTLLTSTVGNYFVKTENACGDTVSNTISLTVNLAAIFVQDPLDQNLNPGVTAVFTAIPDLTSATLQWQQDAGSGFISLSNGGQYFGVTFNSLSVSNLNVSQNGYAFRCIATQGNCTDTSNSAYLYVLPNGINEIINTNNFTLFPNPSNGSFQLELKTPHDFNTLEIETLLGEIVHEEKLADEPVINIKLKAIAKGIYLVQLRGENSIETKLLIIE